MGVSLVSRELLVSLADLLKMGEVRPKPIHIKTKNWVLENEKFFLPPVCNKIPHSPQREKDTVGLVIERERMPEETDGLRYFVEGTTDILFERWFFCDDLGVQLKPVIEEFFASDECKTGVPGPDSVNKNPPWVPDSKRVVENPFNLQDWLDAHRRLIRSSGSHPLFSPTSYQSDITVMGLGQGSRVISAPAETFLWQLEGSAVIILGTEEIRLRRDETLLIPTGEEFEYIPS